MLRQEYQHTGYAIFEVGIPQLGQQKISRWEFLNGIFEEWYSLRAKDFLKVLKNSLENRFFIHRSLTIIITVAP